MQEIAQRTQKRTNQEKKINTPIFLSISRCKNATKQLKKASRNTW